MPSASFGPATLAQETRDIRFARDGDLGIVVCEGVTWAIFVRSVGGDRSYTAALRTSCGPAVTERRRWMEVVRPTHRRAVPVPLEPLRTGCGPGKRRPGRLREEACLT